MNIKKSTKYLNRLSKKRLIELLIDRQKYIEFAEKQKKDWCISFIKNYY